MRQRLLFSVAFSYGRKRGECTEGGVVCNVKKMQLALQLAFVAACTRPPLLLLSEPPDAHQTRADLYAPFHSRALKKLDFNPPPWRSTRTLGANHIEGRSFLPSRAGQLGIYTSRSRQGPASCLGASSPRGVRLAVRSPPLKGTHFCLMSTRSLGAHMVQSHGLVGRGASWRRMLRGAFWPIPVLGCP